MKGAAEGGVKANRVHNCDRGRRKEVFALSPGDWKNNLKAERFVRTGPTASMLPVTDGGEGARNLSAACTRPGRSKGHEQLPPGRK